MFIKHPGRISAKRCMSSQHSPIEQAACLIWQDDPKKKAARDVLLQLIQDSRLNHDALIEKSAETSLGAAGGRELVDLTYIVEIHDQLTSIGTELKELEELMEDEELGVIAEAEATVLEAKRKELGSCLVVALLKQAKQNETQSGESKKSVIEGAIVEVRAGTGGDEAGFFASELFEMVHIVLKFDAVLLPYLSFVSDSMQSSRKPKDGQWMLLMRVEVSREV